MAGPYLWANPRAASLRSNRCGGLACFVPTSPRGSAPLAQCAREAAPFSLTLGTAELRRPPPRPPLKRSSYAGSYGWRWWCSRWLRSSCVAGVFPRSPPLAVGGFAPRGRPSVARTPRGVRWRGPPGPFRQRPAHPPWLTFGVGWRAILQAVLSRPCLAGGLAGLCPGLCLAPVTSVFPGCALRRGPLGPRSAPGALPPPRPGYASGDVAPSAASAKPPPPLFSMCSYGVAFNSFIPPSNKSKKQLTPQPILEIIDVSLCGLMS